MSNIFEPGRFTKCPAYMPRETAQGYLGRLTSFFGAASPKHFCRDYMLDLKGIQHGQPHALKLLADMTGADLSDMLRSTPVRIDFSFMSLAGEILHTRINPRHEIRMCPLCAREDIAASPGVPIDQAVYTRREWMIGVVDVCHKHAVQLVSHRAPIRTAVKLDIGYESGFILDQLDAITPVPATLDDFQLYVLSRIGNIPRRPSSLLDGVPLEVVTQLCQAAGLDLLRRRDGISKPSAFERRAAGFEMLGHGAEGLEEMFLLLRQGLRLPEKASRLIPRLLEYLHESVHFERDLGEFVDVLSDICFRNLPYAAGQILLGRSCPRRWLYDYPTAMRAHSIGRHHLYALAKAQPQIGAYFGDRRQDTLLYAEGLDDALTGRTPVVSAEEVRAMLGLNARRENDDLTLLVEVGMFCPLLSSCEKGAPPFYSKPDVDSALQELMVDIEWVEVEQAGTVPLWEALMKLLLNRSDFWRLVWSGRIKKVTRVKGQTLYSGLRVNEQELLDAMTGVTHSMTAKQVQEALRLTYTDVNALVASGSLTTIPTRDGVESRLLHIFDGADVSAFDDTYISRQRIRYEQGGRSAVFQLRRAGIKPAIDVPSRVRGRPATIFYRRADLKTLL